MKNKVLKGIMTAFVFVPFMFSMASCDNNGNNNGNSSAASDGTISETEWQNVVCEKNFTVSLNDYSMRCETDNFYEIYSGKKDNSLETVYLKAGYYKVVNNGDKWWNKMQVSSKDEYESNITGALNIVNYVKSNKAIFTTNKKESETEYVAQIPDNLKEDIKNLANILHVSNSETFLSSIETMKVYKKTETVIGKLYTNTYLEFETGNNENLTFTFDNAVSQFWIKKELDGLKKFTIIGGPSETDVDYSELYFIENGFRVYFPNRTDATQRDVYYQYDEESDTYYVYRQDENGAWSKNSVNKINYDNVRDQTFALYFGNILSNSSSLKYSRELHSTSRRDDYTESKAISNENAQGTWWYYDINIDSNNTRVESATYKMKFTNGETSTEEYNMNLSIGNISLSYPEV